jgi:NADH:ubiquinone oxidoreductase subunit K
MFQIDLTYFLLFTFVFFLLNLVLLLASLDHFILVLIFLDLLLLTNAFMFIVYTILTGFPIGYSYGLLILGIAAADTAVGLGLFLVYHKATNSISIKM